MCGLLSRAGLVRSRKPHTLPLVDNGASISIHMDDKETAVILTDEEKQQAAAIATHILLTLDDLRIPEGYARWAFLDEVKDLTGICWNCGYNLPESHPFCYCQRDD